MTNRFQKWAIATTVATYLLILVGGMVRASDAGLGCPDWPMCFGKPYPPFTMEEFRQREIPADFDAENFHVSLAWIEYTNRLTGSVIGLLVIGTLAYALVDHRQNKRILYPTLGAFVTVLINGWMGSQVIESRLNQVVLTAHLMLAWVQMILLLYATVSAFYPEGGLPSGDLGPQRRLLGRVALAVLGLVLIQGTLGTVVRGHLETIEEDNPQMERADYIGEVGVVDYVHRTFSWTILIGVGWLFYYAHKQLNQYAPLRYSTQLAALLVIVQVSAGIGMAYAGVPPPLQAIHLVVGSLLMGAVTLVYLLATRLPVIGGAASPDRVVVMGNSRA